MCGSEIKVPQCAGQENRDSSRRKIWKFIRK
jgi:hypothetical protein